MSSKRRFTRTPLISGIGFLFARFEPCLNDFRRISCRSSSFSRDRLALVSGRRSTFLLVVFNLIFGAAFSALRLTTISVNLKTKSGSDCIHFLRCKVNDSLCDCGGFLPDKRILARSLYRLRVSSIDSVLLNNVVCNPLKFGTGFTLDLTMNR